MQHTPKHYRADITGLRALAVISVLLFHISPKYLAGGYLGVDIFFVISGFLITTILLKEQNETGKVSLLKFYKRRLLRIAPATIFTVTIAIIFANLYLGSFDIRKISLSAIYSTFGFANLYFKNHLATGYFAPSTALTPLLHLWSLGVEEQFYLLLPAMFLLLGKYKKSIFCTSCYFICCLCGFRLYYGGIEPKIRLLHATNEGFCPFNWLLGCHV